MLLSELTPIGNHAFRLIVEEMETLNGRVTLDDILDLGRKGLLTVPRLAWLLDQLENATDLWKIMHPAFAPTFPHIIEKMGEWEKDGVFEKMSAFKNAGGNLLGSMSPEDIAKTGEGLAFLISQLQRLADPDLQAKITNLIGMLGEIDTANVKPTAFLALLGRLAARRQTDSGPACRTDKSSWKVHGAERVQITERIHGRVTRNCPFVNGKVRRSCATSVDFCVKSFW